MMKEFWNYIWKIAPEWVAIIFGIIIVILALFMIYLWTTLLLFNAWLGFLPLIVIMLGLILIVWDQFAKHKNKQENDND